MIGTLDEIMNTPDDSDHGYYIACGIIYTNSCKDRTEQLALMPNKRKITDNESGYREKETCKIHINLRSKQKNRVYGSL